MAELPAFFSASNVMAVILSLFLAAEDGEFRSSSMLRFLALCSLSSAVSFYIFNNFNNQIIIFIN